MNHSRKPVHIYFHQEIYAAPPPPPPHGVGINGTANMRPLIHVVRSVSAG